MSRFLISLRMVDSQCKLNVILSLTAVVQDKTVTERRRSDEAHSIGKVFNDQ